MLFLKQLTSPKDGTAPIGVDLPTDVFVYVVEGSFTTFQPFKLTGNVTLFR